MAAAAPARDAVVERVLAIVAEKTGYPPDMLDLELDLEADLGVDTVKQAETFAAVREAYDIERQENLKLRDFPTLRHVVQFVYDNRPDLKPVASSARLPAAPHRAARRPRPVPARRPRRGGPAVADPVAQKVLAIVAEKTGYPQDMLELDLDLEADLGVDTVKQAETFAAVREAYGIERQENLKLRDFPTLRSVVRVRLRVPAGPEAGRVAGRGCAARPRAGSGGSASGRRGAAPARLADPVVQKVLAVVAEKTGYPQDMLELDLDLEADLGVDTVKQAETFAAVREAYGIERQENLKLRDFPTLRSVVGFVYQFRPDLTPTVSLAPAAAAAAAPRASRRPPWPPRRSWPSLPRPTAGAAAGGLARSGRAEGARRSWPRRPATRRTCWSWTSTSRRTSASTR